MCVKEVTSSNFCFELRQQNNSESEKNYKKMCEKISEVGRRLSFLKHEKDKRKLCLHLLSGDGLGDKIRHCFYFYSCLLKTFFAGESRSKMETIFNVLIIECENEISQLIKVREEMFSINLDQELGVYRG
jgi:hypothetical protein